MKRTHRIELTIPPSVNGIYSRGKHGVYLNPKCRAWCDINRGMVAAQMPDHDTITLCHIHIKIYGGKGLRKGRDLSNMEKVVGDLLVRTGIIADDNFDVLQKNTQEYMGKAPNKGNAYAEVLVHELHESQRVI